MNYLDCVTATITIHRNRFWRLCVSAVLSAAWCMGNLTSLAAPVTLQFEATVGPPRQGFDSFLPPSWNVSLQQGDAISGTFTFEPFDAASDVPTTLVDQPFSFAIQIKTRTLSMSEFSVEVANDEMPIDALLTDNIKLGCMLGSGEACAPAGVPTDPIEWWFAISLYGDTSVLNGADIPADPNVWEQFLSDNTILVSFKEPISGWSSGFLATVDSFRAVPEPATSLMLIFGCVLMLLARRFLPNRNWSSLR